jgi:hypothetical protein
MNSYLKITMPVHRSFSEGGNGRVYDPKLARFLNPDPVIANPTFTQDYNAYSYVRNNPLGYVDPSGYILISAAVRAWAEGLLRDGGENGSYYTSSGGGGLYNFTSQDNAFVAASNILDMSNGWSYTEAGTREGSEYNFNSAMGYYKSVNRKRITGFNINFRFTSKSHERTSLNIIRLWNPSFSLFSYKNVVKEVWVGPNPEIVDPDPEPDATNGGVYGPDDGYRFGTIDEFYAENKDYTYDQIIHQRGVDVDGRPIGPDMRFVEDPLNKGKYIDMRHMLVVGKNYGSVVGALGEIAQWFGPWFGRNARGSALNPQDIYSNNLGETFFMNYYSIPGQNFNDKLRNYLNNHYRYDSIID